MFAGRVEASSEADAIDAAARIWAEATAARDGDPVAGPVDIAHAKIVDALSRAEDAMLVIASSSGGEPAGFAVIAPSADCRCELHYLGVDPRLWGRGIGSRLLDEIIDVACSHGHTCLELWVYRDNPSAVALYERAGWRDDQRRRTHPLSGRTEKHLVRTLASRKAPPATWMDSRLLSSA